MRKNIIILIIGLAYTLPSFSQDIKIGLLFDQFAALRWQKDASYLKKNLEQLGAQTFLEVAHSDMSKQIAQAESMIAKDYDALIVVCVDAIGAKEIVNKAAAQNIPVIAYDRPIMHEGIALYISYDNKEAGRMQARSAIESITKGNIIMINGPVSDNNATQFRNGQMEILETLVANGDINVKHDLILDSWDEMAPLLSLMELSIDVAKIDAIISAADVYNQSIIDYIDNETESKRIFITGQDLSQIGISNIKKGFQNMSVLKPLEPLAKKTAELTMQLINQASTVSTETIELDGISFSGYLFQPILVNQENIDTYLSQSK